MRPSVWLSVRSSSASVLLAVLLTSSPGLAQCPGWSADFGPQASGLQTGSIRTMVVFDDGHGPQLYAAGGFSSIGGVVAQSIARFDGTHWSALDPNFTPQLSIYSLVVLDEGSGPALFAVGDGATSAWRFDGTSWSPTAAPFLDFAAVFDPGTGPRIYAPASGGLGNMTLYSYDSTHGWQFVLDFFGGGTTVSAAQGNLGAGPRLFFVIGGTLEGFDGTAMFNPGAGLGVGKRPETVAVFDDGNGQKLYTAGDKSTPGGSPAFVSRRDGTTWVDIGGTIVDSSPSDRGIHVLGVHDFGSGPRLIAAGDFSSIGGVAANNIAAWDGTTWSPLGSGLGSSTSSFPAVASFDRGDAAGPSLFVTGAFTQAGGVPSGHIANFESCGGPATLYCFGDGSATACPCGNASAPGSQSGCLNSTGIGSTLRVHGQAQLTHDTLRLEGAGMPNSSALYFQGANVAVGGQGFQFGDGVKCVAGPFVRLGTKLNVNGASVYPTAGNPSVSAKGMITTSGTRYYQVHYRNAGAFCTSATFNMTNAAQIAWAP